MPALAHWQPADHPRAAEQTLDLAKIQLVSIFARQDEVLRSLATRAAKNRAADLDTLAGLHHSALVATSIVYRASDELRAYEARQAHEVIQVLALKHQLHLQEIAALGQALEAEVEARRGDEGGAVGGEEQDATRIKREDSA
ncbi:hypothetical protein JCM10450v2_005120 [Rhodotorula kratochvilovae]